MRRGHFPAQQLVAIGLVMAGALLAFAQVDGIVAAVAGLRLEALMLVALTMGARGGRGYRHTIDPPG